MVRYTSLFRKSFILTILTLSFFPVLAQNSNINRAKSSLKKGDYTLALEYIAKAEEHSKTKVKPETYLTKSNIIKTMMFKEDSTNLNVETKNYNAWKSAIKKTKETAKGNNKYTFFIDNTTNQLSINYFNIGVMAYQKKKNENAFKLFSRAYDINKKNISALQNAATIGIDLEKYAEIEPYYETLINQDSVDINNVFRYLNMLAYKQKKYDKALKIIEKAMVKFPDNKELQEQEINMYIKTDRLEEAKNKLEAKLKNDSNPNPEQYVRLGQFYGHLKNDKKMIEAFEMAYSLDKKNAIVLQNIGVHYYNKAVEIKNSVGKLNDKEYAKKGASMLKKADIEFQRAANYFEKLVEVDKKDKETLEHLLNIYTILKKKDKVKALDEKLKNL